MSDEILKQLRQISERLPDPIDPELIGKIIDALPDAIVMIDSHGTIMLTNKQTELLFGYPHGELMGQPLEVLIPEEARERHAQHRQQFFLEPRSRPMGAGLPLKGRHKSGREFLAEINLAPIVTSQGTFAIANVRKKRE